MSNNNSVTWLDQLATETILEIFEYLSSNDIIYTFFDFNQRLNSILLYHRCSNNFKTPTTNLNFWQSILPNIGSYIEHLIITTNDFNFSLNLFPNLKSIILSSTLPIGRNLLNSLIDCEQFNQLISFKIKSKIFYVEGYPQYISDPMFKKIFHQKNSLETFECLSELSLYNSGGMQNLTIHLKIHSLSLKLENFLDIFPVLRYTPNVKYLNFIISSMHCQQTLISYQDLFEIKLQKFCLTLSEIRGHNFSEECFARLRDFLRHFSSSLNYLSLNLIGQSIIRSLTFQLNGILLQQQLLEPLIQLKTFHFYAEFQDLPNNIENIISTFRNQFWFNHHWSIGMHRKYIYTLPFHFDQLDGFIDFDHIKSNDLNSPQIWHRVKSIHFLETHLKNTNLIEQLKIKMPNLSSIIFPKNQEVEIIPTTSTLENVKTVYFKNTVTEDVQQWLIKILPNLKHLILSDTYYFIPIKYQNIERLTIHNIKFITRWKEPIKFYFSNLKYVEIEFNHPGPYHFMKLIKIFSYCNTLVLYFPSYKINYGTNGIIDINKMFNKLDLIELQQDCNIKHGYDCLEFTKKN